VAPGTTIVLNVSAVDSDARVVDFQFTGTDASGQAGLANLSITVSDPVTVVGEVEDPAGTATLTRDPVNQNVWRATV
jgi:hypothetical protein